LFSCEKAFLVLSNIDFLNSDTLIVNPFDSPNGWRLVFVIDLILKKCKYLYFVVIFWLFLLEIGFFVVKKWWENDNFLLINTNFMGKLKFLEILKGLSMNGCLKL